LKHLLSGILGKKGRSVEKKKDADDFCKGNIRQLSIENTLKVRFTLFSKKCKLEKKFVLKLKW